MENRTPFDLNEAIRRWQENLGDSPAFGADNLEELASHLRASVQSLKADGLSEEEAFLIATRRIGRARLAGKGICQSGRGEDRAPVGLYVRTAAALWCVHGLS